MKEVMEILNDLRFKQIIIDIDASGNNLSLSGPLESLSEEDRSRLRQHKQDILVFLESRKKRKSVNTFSGIPKAPVKDSYPLSSSQKRLWILDQLEGAVASYNIPNVYVFEGDIDLIALRWSFHELIARHEILRTVFREDEHGNIAQQVLIPGDVAFDISFYDLCNETDRDSKILSSIQADLFSRFDLSQGPLMRASLYKADHGKWIFSYVMHHIISDAWSMSILFAELLSGYGSYKKGSQVLSGPLPIHYKDYAVWQNEQLKSELYKAHKEYWLKQFEGELPVMDLPMGRVRPAVKTYNGDVVSCMISPAKCNSLRKLSQQHGGTLYTGLLATVVALLYKYTVQEDIIIGTPVGGREHTDQEGQIGFYTNTLALRNKFSGEDSFARLLERVAAAALLAYEHQAYPFDELVENLQLSRDISRNPLFDIMISLQDTDNEKSRSHEVMEGLTVSSYNGVRDIVSKFDLTFDFAESANGLQLQVEYNTDLFDRSAIERISIHLCNILSAVIANPSLALKELDYLSVEEKHQLLYEFNTATELSLPGKTIIELFEEQVSHTPQNTALIFSDVKLSYYELSERVDRLSGYLCKEYDIKANDRIALMLDRSEWLIIAMLAIMKSGAAYVPIDTAYPRSRIDYILRDSGCKAVLDSAALKAYQDAGSGHAIPLFSKHSSLSDLAYIIYTSGSTGQPKGVMIEHASLADYAITFRDMFGIGVNDRVIQQFSISFDAHIEEVYPTLISGATLLVSVNGGKDIDELSRLIQNNNATVLSASPLVLNELNIARVRSNCLRLIISGGDVFRAAYVDTFIGRVDIYDSYGPTESTVSSTFFRIEDKEASSIIGKPIRNRYIYILDDNGSLLPEGAVGEICIGGIGLARGYLNNEQLTSMKFISDPFRPGGRIYRTGDLGKWLPGGDIAFSGRKDSQVKIRGYRIELAEIEHHLLQAGSVTAAAVIPFINPEGDKELAAYLVSGEKPDEAAIRASLSRSLPAYMIPSRYIVLDRLPLTSNGKIDRKSLPAPGRSLPEASLYVAPRNPIESRLVEIWKEVLGKEQVGVKDNFFELGGHSLRAARLVMQVKKEYKVEVDLKSVFLEPTIEVLADKISNDLWLQGSLAGEEDSYDEIKL